ncbi:hypothetical protein EB796_020479 [Bugula neritina]|uniref:Uncharacterized protein n=1 Tax=Bugula neritina TaxID=10212 RepID=A0A7J7J4V6_BUGNE|nr:hypothetical protein EB796_020479 [Bugula neritina]
MVRSYKVNASSHNISQVVFTVDIISKKTLGYSAVSNGAHITQTRWLQNWSCSLHRLVCTGAGSANCLSDARQEIPYADSQRDSSDSL